MCLKLLDPCKCEQNYFLTANSFVLNPESKSNLAFRVLNVVSSTHDLHLFVFASHPREVMRARLFLFSDNFSLGLLHKISPTLSLLCLILCQLNSLSPFLSGRCVSCNKAAVISDTCKYVGGGGESEANRTKNVENMKIFGLTF